MHSPDPGPQIAVLDTNVVLDWAVFRNPGCAAPAAAIVTGRLRWVATAEMRDELEHVLARGHLDVWRPDLPAVRALWDRHCEQLPTPAPTGPGGRLRCSDPDDQKFIDIAVSAGARWLLSRDRAVLKLANRLREHGVAVVVPEAWPAIASTHTRRP